jgi:hypothetical protein
VRTTQLVAALMLGFLIITIALSSIGLIEITFINILTYLAIILGISLVYPGFIQSNKLMVYFGSAVFLLGILFLVQLTFEITGLTNITLSLVLLVNGCSFLMVYLVDVGNKLFLVLTLIFILSGIILLFINNCIALDSYFRAIASVGKSFWHILIVMIIIILLFNRGTTK